MITGGRGLKNAENFKMIEKLAEKLGAAGINSLNILLNKNLHFFFHDLHCTSVVVLVYVCTDDMSCFFIKPNMICS